MTGNTRQNIVAVIVSIVIAGEVVLRFTVPPQLRWSLEVISPILME